MLLIRRQHAWLSEHTDLIVGTTGGEEERKRSLTHSYVESVSSVPPQLVLPVGKQIRNVDEAAHRCLLSAAACVIIVLQPRVLCVWVCSKEEFMSGNTVDHACVLRDSVSL